MRVLLAQWTGDFREAYHRLASGGPETYRAQRYTVDAVGELAKRFGTVGQLTYFTETKYAETLPTGAEAIGLGLQDRLNVRAVIEQLTVWKPTHLIQRCIVPEVLRWAVAAGIRVMLLCAETRREQGIRNWWRNRGIARALNDRRVEWCCNHQVNAARWLERIGVRADKIIPWDYVYSSSPEDHPAKTLTRKGDDWTLAFVGAISEGKGILEIVNAVEWLTRRNVPVRVRLAGAGEIDRFKDEARRLGIADRFEFHGLMSNTEALRLMRDADLVIVPSRHEYSEAFPLTILEGFLSRTPLIVSDHPMFRGRVVPGQSGLMFPARNGIALAECIQKALGDANLYRQMSENSVGAWKAMQIPAHWDELMVRWLEDTPLSREWMSRHRLSSGLYG